MIEVSRSYHIEKLKEEVEPLVMVGDLNIDNPMTRNRQVKNLRIELEHVIFAYEILPKVELSKEKVNYKEKYLKKEGIWDGIWGRSKKFSVSIQKTCIA